MSSVARAMLRAESSASVADAVESAESVDVDEADLAEAAAASTIAESANSIVSRAPTRRMYKKKIQYFFYL